MDRLLVIILLSLSTSTAFSQNPLQWGNLKPGSYAVGYKAIQTLDYSRNYIGGHKPVQIYMWYPCEKDNSNQMTFEQYIKDAVNDLGDSNIYAHHIKSKIVEEFKNGQLNPSFGASLSNEDFRKITNTSVPVTLHGKPMRGRFPLLLHIHANGALHQSLMMEYLASYGYVVVSISMYNTTPAHYGRGEEGSNAMLSQVEDLAFLISEARKFDFIDHKKMAMIGMVSQAGLALQMKENLLSAIACLDCQLNERTMEQLPFYSAKNVNIPFLHLVNTQFQKQENNYLDSLKYSERYLYRFKNFPHSDFYPFPKIAKPEESKTYINYEFVLQSTLHFLNAFLKNDEQEKQILINPSLDSNYPHGYVTVTKLAAEKPLMRESEFLTSLRYGQIEAAQKEWNEHPEIKRNLSNENFFSVVLFLCRDGEPHAFDALKMYSSVYGHEAKIEMLYKLLGDAYLNKKTDMAQMVFSDYHKNFPDSPAALEGLIAAYQVAGNKSNARIAAKNLIELVNRVQPKEVEKIRLLAIAEKVIKEK